MDTEVRIAASMHQALICFNKAFQAFLILHHAGSDAFRGASVRWWTCMQSVASTRCLNVGSTLLSHHSIFATTNYSQCFHQSHNSHDVRVTFIFRFTRYHCVPWVQMNRFGWSECCHVSAEQVHAVPSHDFPFILIIPSSLR